jgi:hypothetical protein
VRYRRLLTVVQSGGITGYHALENTPPARVSPGDMFASYCRRITADDMEIHRGRNHMRIFSAAAVFVLLAGPAFAQAEHVPRYGEADPDKTPQQVEADKAAAKAYQRSLGNIPDQGKIDPWGSARATDAPKAAVKTEPKPAKTSAAKTAKTSPKTGVSAN